MGVSELAREAAERRKGLTDVAKVVRSVGKSLTAILSAITRIKKRKKGLPSLDDLGTVVKLITAASQMFTTLEKLVPTITQIFKIVG